MRKVLIGIGVYVAVMAALAIYCWHIWTFGTDTGTFSQIVSDAFGGFRDGPEQGTHFRFHWAPILATLWPIVALTHSALSLEIAQIVLTALAAIPLYLLVRAHADEGWLAVRCGLLALFYPPLAAVAFLEFHEIAFYAATAIALFWAADAARWGWFAILAVVAALIREEAWHHLLDFGQCVCRDRLALHATGPARVCSSVLRANRGIWRSPDSASRPRAQRRWGSTLGS